jgi:GLPGLI family protein
MSAMRKYAMILICLLLSLSGRAQHTFHGKIEFEKKTNVHRQFESMDDDREWYDRIKSQVPKFNTTYFNYYFNDKFSVYKPGKEVENNFKMFGGSPASENVVYTDFNAKKVSAAKQVFEEQFLVQDSMRVLEWKISDEIRTIANYKCRKAVGKICDTVVVVAFYTEDIAVSGGPEMFSGLPGMILELAVPRLYTTWIATSVEVIPPTAADLKAPAKGKKVTQGELYTTIQKGIKRWGEWGQRSIWWCML